MKLTHGNKYQKGFPDRFIFHAKYGTRWVDYKQPTRNSLTNAQQKEWPEWHAYGVGIWILTGATESEYKKLFDVPNWQEFWKKRYGTLDIDAMLAALATEDK